MSFELRSALRLAREKRRATCPEKFPQSYTTDPPSLDPSHHRGSAPPPLPKVTDATISRRWCFGPDCPIEDAQKREPAWQRALEFLEGKAGGVEEKIGMRRNLAGEWKVSGAMLWKKYGGEVEILDDEDDGDGGKKDAEKGCREEGRREEVLKKTRDGNDLWESGLWRMQLGFG